MQVATAENVDDRESFKANLRDAKHELLRRGFSLAGYARAKGFNVLTFRMWLRGEWGSAGCGGEVSDSYLSALKADGIYNSERNRS